MKRVGRDQTEPEGPHAEQWDEKQRDESKELRRRGGPDGLRLPGGLRVERGRQGGEAEKSDLPPEANPNGTVEVGTAADYPRDGVFAKYARTDRVYVVRQGGRLYALRSMCTHRACLLEPVEGELLPLPRQPVPVGRRRDQGPRQPRPAALRHRPEPGRPADGRQIQAVRAGRERARDVREHHVERGAGEGAPQARSTVDRRANGHPWRVGKPTAPAPVGTHLKDRRARQNETAPAAARAGNSRETGARAPSPGRPPARGAAGRLPAQGTRNPRPGTIRDMTTATIPVTTQDPINAKILSVSEDKIQGFQPDPLGEIARLSRRGPAHRHRAHRRRCCGPARSAGCGRR